jgi:hypothetical protein
MKEFNRNLLQGQMKCSVGIKIKLFTYSVDFTTLFTASRFLKNYLICYSIKVKHRNWIMSGDRAEGRKLHIWCGGKETTHLLRR